MLSYQKLILGSLGTNCYLVNSDTLPGHVCIIDPGASPDIILDTLKEQKLVPDFIVLTHGHFDHIGAVDDLVIKTKVPFYISAGDKEILQSTKYNSSDQTEEPFVVQSSPDRLLKDGDCLYLGNDVLKVMETPGHTRGSISLYSEGLLFSGDTLFYHNFGRFDLPGGSLRDIRKSLAKLMDLPEDTVVCPGHGEESTIEEENRYLFPRKDLKNGL